MKFSVGAGDVEFVKKAEALGVHQVQTGEAWGMDAITRLAFLAAHTTTIRLCTGILQLGARTPAMVAMTAASMDELSGGRFILGLGASGPQVVEGLHGVRYDRPLTRMRETIEIVRLGLSGERLRYDGKAYQLPLPGGEGKAIRLDTKPRRIPIYLATLAPRALEFTGAVADGWLGTSFSPEHAGAHFDHIARGAASAGRSLDDIELQAACSIAIGDDVEELIDSRRPGVAFNMGAMGSATTNFYNDAFCRAGFEDDAKAIQRLWLDGKRDEAARRVPDAMITRFQAIGTPAMIRERFEKYRDAGVDCLGLRLNTPEANRIEELEQILDIAKDL